MHLQHSFKRLNKQQQQETFPWKQPGTRIGLKKSEKAADVQKEALKDLQKG